MSGSAWIIGDDAQSAHHLGGDLERNGWNVRDCVTPEEMLAALETVRPGLILAVRRLPGGIWIALLREGNGHRTKDPGPPDGR